MNAFVPVVNAFRFYADGTESGSAPLGNQDAGITVNVDPGNQQVHLRYRIDETGAGSINGAATDDYRLQYSKNAGAFANVNGVSANVQTDTGSSLTDGVATTDRATNGIGNPASGAFVAGIQEEGDGEITNWQLTADNFTEHVWAVLVIAANVANGDTLDFRVTLNGGAPGMTNNVTPRITIQKSPPLATGSGWWGGG